jgi:hypothetical protein
MTPTDRPSRSNGTPRVERWLARITACGNRYSGVGGDIGDIRWRTLTAVKVLPEPVAI